LTLRRRWTPLASSSPSLKRRRPDVVP
jgi:hypothetical protein